MSTNNICKTIVLLLTSILINAAMIMPAQAITPAQKPLYIGSSRALPNIMLMIDNSGSMSTNVTTPSNIPSDMNTKEPYFSYSCITPVFGGAATAAAATTIVNMIVDSSGVPRFCTNSLCTTSTAFNQAKCFSNNLYYKVKYKRGDSSLSTVYQGINLNWYFTKGTFNKGSLIWVATTKTRMAIAKEAATALVNSLLPDDLNNSKVRLGLTTFNGNTGGKILSDLGELTTSYAEDVIAQIATLTPTGFTPLAEVLADIGRYFSDGGNAYTGNLTLHPGQSNEASATLDTIYSSRSIVNGTDHATLNVAVENYCQKNFTILVTDGLPNKDREISASLRDYTGDCATKGLCDSTPSADGTSDLPSGTLLSTVSTCNPGKYYLACKNGAKAGRKYESYGSDYLDDVAQALFEMDLRPNLIKPTAGSKNNLVTYAIGFADPSLTEDLNGNGILDPGEDANGNGKLDNDSVLKDAAVRGGGKFYFANNLGELSASFSSILSDISSKVGSSSSVAANSTKLGNDTAIYQAKFDSADWTGNFSALPLSNTEDTNGNGVLDTGEDTNGNGKLDAGVIDTRVWEAGENIPAFASRKIFTYNPGSSPKGVLFECNNLSSSQKTQLGITDCSNSSDQGVWRLNYLRGDFTHEQKNPVRKSTDPNPELRPSGGIFRNRSRIDITTGFVLQPDPWLLSDIVNSDPVYVSDKDYGYYLLPATEPEGASYRAFVTANKNRQKMVYVGANDGMFHAYDANLVSANAGDELFAFIPNAVYGQLNELSKPSYSHLYSVDGDPRASDVFFKDIDNAWHTVIVSGTGAGAKAVFALDITDPDNFSGNDVLWEISDTTSPLATDLTTDTPALRGFEKNMGFSIPQASIAKLHDGSWVAVVANGYGSTNNLAVLYLVEVQTGHIIKALNTAAGDTDHPNGLSAPVPVDTDGDRIIDVIYAGDLLGNMWKFDVSSTSPDAWNVAFGGSPLFVACSNTASCETTRQPITSDPQVGRSGTSQHKEGIMVYFGTGKYFEDGDISVTDAQTQSLYGIWDHDAPIARSGLQQQTITNELTTGVFKSRITSDTPVDYATKNGWYMDLLKPGAAASDGERSVSTPLMRGDNVVFTTLIPVPPTVSDECSSGSDGVGWLMELNALSGGRYVNTSGSGGGGGGSGGGGPFDTNNDGTIDSHDSAYINADGSATTLSGIQPEYGIFDTPTVVSVNRQVELKIINGTNQSTGPGTITEKASVAVVGTGARQSWQQLNID